MTTAGPELALLLLASYRRLVDRAVDELARRGFPDITQTHHYAMSAIERGAVTASQLGEALEVTKQAAAKTVTALLARKFIEVEPDSEDSRRKLLRVTDLGRSVMSAGAEVFDELRAEWAAEIGPERMLEFENVLREFAGDATIRLDHPGWPARH